MSDRTTSWSANEQERKEQMSRVVATVRGQEEKYRGLLPSDVDAEDFINAFIISVNKTPRLLEADRDSLYLGLLSAASDGLKPDGREGALVIFGDDQEDEDGNP